MTLLLWSCHGDLESLHGDPLAVWEPWCTDLRGHRVDSGHHVAEENSADLTAALPVFFAVRGAS